jgi:hypothetical protein
MRKNSGYERPPKTYQTFVPKVYKSRR